MTNCECIVNVFDRTLPLWKQFENKINQYELYSKEDEPMIDEIMEGVRTKPASNIQEITSAGTSLKLVITNEENVLGLFKPKRLRFFKIT